MWRRPPSQTGSYAPGGERRFLYAASLSVIAGDFDRHGFNTRHFTFDSSMISVLKPRDSAQRRYIRQACSPSPVLPYRQSLPEYRVAVGAVIFAREHTAELKLRQFSSRASSSATASLKVSSSSALQPVPADQKHLPAPVSFGRGIDNGFEGGTLLTQRLCAFGSFQTSGCSSSAFTSSRRSFLRHSQRYPLRTSERSVRS